MPLYIKFFDNTLKQNYASTLIIQTDYAVDAITKLVKHRAKSIRVTEKAMTMYWDWIQEEMKNMVYGPSSPVQGWYRNSKSVNWTSYPASLVKYWWTTRSVNLADFEMKF